MITATTVGFIVGLLLKTSVTVQQNVSFLNGLPENFTSDGAIDVQYTSCKVITDRIVATAEGKFSRFCHGICNINETNARLHRIETLLIADAENIKQRLFYMERVLSKGQIISKTGEGDAVDTGRLREIGTYNGTVSTIDDSSAASGGRPRASTTAFVYYWRVNAFWRLSFAADGLARSPPFYVSPRSYRISLTVHSDVTARTVRVAAVPAAGEYDAQLRWPFAHRLRLSVLDQTDVRPEDIVSRIWDDVRCTVAPPTPPTPHQNSQHYRQIRTVDPEVVCASMEFRHEVLTYRRYAASDALVVKLTSFVYFIIRHIQLLFFFPLTPFEPRVNSHFGGKSTTENTYSLWHTIYIYFGNNHDKIKARTSLYFRLLPGKLCAMIDASISCKNTKLIF